MESKKIIIVFLTLVITTSCFHLHLIKVPKKYIHSITANISLLAPEILQEYKSNISIYVDSIANSNLKTQLINLNVTVISITYKLDTTGRSRLYPNPINFIDFDSCINFEHKKDMTKLHLDNWNTSNIVCYYFGKIKPSIKSSKDEFSNLSKKINDSMCFDREHSPPNR